MSLRNRNRESSMTLKLVSLLLALLIWVTLSGRQTEEDTKQSRVYQQIPLVFSNIPPSMKLNMDHYQIRVTISGNREDLEALDDGRIQIKLNLEGLRSGSYNLPLTRDNVIIPDNLRDLEVVDIIPDVVHLDLEEFSEKPLRISMEAIGEPAENFEFVDLILTPPVVTIEGPTRQVKDLILLLADPVYIDNLSESQRGRVSFDFRSQIPSRAVIKEDLSDLYYEVIIKEKVIEKSYDTEFEVRVSEPGAHKVQPENVRLKVSGPITLVQWMEPSWVVPEVLIPQVVLEDMPEPEPQVEADGTSESARDVFRNVPISESWNLPEEAKLETPDWFSRVSKLEYYWTPAEIRVEEL